MGRHRKTSSERPEAEQPRFVDPGDRRAFSAAVESYRKQLQTHCYRMLGSILDAEDMVQETFLRAWKNLRSFERRGSMRSWLYRIATNTCLDHLRKRPKRTLPQRSAEPSDPAAPLESPKAEPVWLEPYADELVSDPEPSTEARYTTSESISLAFVAVLQSLPPRQRAVLILFDVLDWKAKEIADLLQSSVSAVTSALHRARSTMASLYHGRSDSRPGAQELAAPAGLLERYVKAWKAADPGGLTALLKEDATFSMPPVPTWYLGRDSIAAALAAGIFAGDAHSRWLLKPTKANRQPSFAVYQRSEAEDYLLFGIQVIALDAGRINEVVTFLDPRLFESFHLPPKLPS
jgi:RNA polymerase sigma-70 factor (ECF subfamily)